MNEALNSALDALIQRGETVLAGYSQKGNIDQHDLWFQAARSFLAVNDPELEQRLRSVAPKYAEALLSEPYGRASYMLIQEQLEVVKLARYRLVQTAAPAAATDRPTWGDDLDRSIEIKPSIFGISVNLKHLIKAAYRRFRG